jgi:alpha-glucosidase
VAEAHGHPSRRARYASPQGLGQSFNFEIQDADWKAADFRRIINSSLALARESGSTTTWHLGNHDVPRVATRYGLPEDPRLSAVDVARKAARQRHGAGPGPGARGNACPGSGPALLALPGSTYIYQGEELGLHEVPELAPEEITDPWATFSGEKGRDGCRVPLPWSTEGPSLGFGPGLAPPARLVRLLRSVGGGR